MNKTGPGARRRDFAKEAARNRHAEARAAQADLFHAPRQAFSYLARAARLRRRRARGRRADDPRAGNYLKLQQVHLDCWGCTAGARTPKYFGATRAATS